MYLADNFRFLRDTPNGKFLRDGSTFLTADRSFRQCVFGTLRIEHLGGLEQRASVDQHYMPGYFPRKIRTKSIES
jgi:hypothetical protein